MGIRPTPEDRKPIETVFWVQTESGELTRTDPVSESNESVERRLEVDFPLYRIKNIGGNVLRKLI